MSTDVLIVPDCGQDASSPVVCELITAARQLARGSQDHVGVLVLGEAAPAPDAWAARGVDRVYFARGDSSALLPETQLNAATEAVRRALPAVVLLPHAVAGAELAPRLAFRLDGAVATGCVDVSIEGNSVRCTRPCYGGLARELDEFAVAPVVATVRAGVFERAQAQPGRRCELIEVGPFENHTARTKRVDRRIEAASGARLEDAAIIVAGGRGLEGPEGFDLLADLARELGGAVGASRVPCDLGWCPHSWQIGLTGKTVAPELYIAVGISGAGHHMAGCGNARAIVAINSDPEAAIFEDARFGVVGDYRKIVPALIAQLRTLNDASSGKL
ncbi:MAG: electron transfer flavoprotein subunit alpha/FixB family protein [Betaproteobacteria bacterium]|nr:electron transfer flavoprotein subunit alpha/FixB family protein [Betaproteobacteria bacterium]